jgi:hypothetical protein
MIETYCKNLVNDGLGERGIVVYDNVARGTILLNDLSPPNSKLVDIVRFIVGLTDNVFISLFAILFASLFASFIAVDSRVTSSVAIAFIVSVLPDTGGWTGCAASVAVQLHWGSRRSSNVRDLNSIHPQRNERGGLYVFEINVKWLFPIALILCRVRSVLDFWTTGMFLD